MAKSEENRTANPGDQVLESWFTPTEDGYTFRYPSPWLFGHWRSYLVSEQQKRGLMVFLRLRRQLLLRWLLAYVLVGAVVSILVSQQPVAAELSTAATGAAIVGALAAMLAAMLVPHLYLLHKMNPILAQAKRADSLGSLQQQLFGVAGEISNVLLLVGGVGGFMVAAGSVNQLAEGVAQGADALQLAWPGASLVIGVVLTSYFIYLAILKRRIKRDANRAS